MNESNSSPFQMSISLNTLNHLGINLYSNVPAVLSELVANAYDANATEVKIIIEKDQITIADNGDGMTRDEINDRYLTVGYSRRKSQPGPTASGRQPMGRKGIGKLAVFSIADVIQVYSAKNGQRNALEMNRLEIEKLIEDKAESDRSYRPKQLSSDAIDFPKGTTLVLSSLRRKRTANLAIEYLKRRLARRFTILGAKHNFQIYINDNEVTRSDRGFYSALEFIWFFGEKDEEILAECKSARKVERLSGTIDDYNNYTIKGWIGTVGEPKELGDRSEEGNSIVVFARGKLVQENILQEFREARVFAQYVIGDVEADFIDVDDQEDLATSDRQRLVADDPRYQKLKVHIEDAVKKIGLQWTDLRREEGSNRALDNPVIERWYKSLSLDNRKSAKRLFGKIESLPIADIQSKGELYKASILAFEKLALKGLLSTLDEIDTAEGLDALLRIFRGVDDLEAAHYYEIAKGRLQVIKEFTSLVDANSRERVLQQYLFDHLWLLDPSWDRATGSPRLEQTVKKEFDRSVTSDLTDDELAARIDIRYSTFAGKHVIVELKKHDARTSVYQLSEQIDKYGNALKKALKTVEPDNNNWQIEIVCVLGAAPVSRDPDKVAERLKLSDARYVTYDQLIHGAQMAYAAYLEKEKRVSEISSLLDEIDQSFGLVNS
jgi:hypothetical protein